MFSFANSKHFYRKWFGVFLINLELITSSATIYGFSAFFIVLSNHGIYETYCSSSTEVNFTTTTEELCEGQTKQYQNAVTMGIALYDLSAVFVGIATDLLGARFVKLIAIVLHMIGWLAMALIKPGRDYLLYVHTVCTSLSGTMLAITAYASCGYFSKARAHISSLFVGANIAAAVCYSIFHILIESGRITLAQISYIWMSIGFIMVFTSFLNMDWRFSFFKLPYEFDTTLEEPMANRRVSLSVTTIQVSKSKWYQKIYHRTGIWEHMTSPLFILMSLFLALLFLPTSLLSITWYPWVYHITNHNTESANNYTFAFNMSSLASILICPINGFLLGFKVDRSKSQQLLNISISQTMTWLINIISCILCMFAAKNVIIPALIFNTIAHATIEAGTQAALSTCFPAKYIGTLSGMVWTVTGLVSLIQYGLVDLTQDVPMSWRAWLVVVCLILLMSSHLVQIWWKYVEKRRQSVPDTQEYKIKELTDDNLVTRF